MVKHAEQFAHRYETVSKVWNCFSPWKQLLPCAIKNSDSGAFVCFELLPHIVRTRDRFLVNRKQRGTM